MAANERTADGAGAAASRFRAVAEWRGFADPRRRPLRQGIRGACGRHVIRCRRPGPGERTAAPGGAPPNGQARLARTSVVHVRARGAGHVHGLWRQDDARRARGDRAAPIPAGSGADPGGGRRARRRGGIGRFGGAHARVALAVRRPHSSGAPPLRATWSARILAASKRRALPSILSMVSSKSASPRLKRSGLMRATTKARRYGLSKPRDLRLATAAVTASLSSSNFAARSRLTSSARGSFMARNLSQRLSTG